MTKAPASKASGAGKRSYNKGSRPAFRRGDPVARRAAASRKLVKARVRTIENRLSKIEFELFGIIFGESEEE